MEISHLITVIGLSIKIRLLFAMNCQREMRYHEKYNYGSDITCSHLNHTNIDELHNILAFNEIKLIIDKSNLSAMPLNVFEKLPKTKELIITQSDLNFLTNSSMAHFEDLHQLELLSISDNNIKAFSKNSLKGLQYLRVLNMSQNNLSLLEEGTLDNVSDLEELDLSCNNFQKFDKIPFCEVKQLKRLFVQNNFLNSLKNSSIGCLKLLQVLVLDFNQIEDLVPLVQLRYLINIRLSFNKIKEISGIFDGLENLETLNLEGNYIKTVSPTHFQGDLSLEKINLKLNFINSISANSFENLTNLQMINLGSNQLNEFPVFHAPHLDTLTLSNNTMLINSRDFRNLHQIEVLDLSRCNIRIIPKNHFENLNYLKIFDLSHNQITLNSYSFSGLHNVTQLYLTNSNMVILPNYAFQFMLNLQILDISKNQLKHLSNLTFHNLKNLETLNISYNLLEVLEENVFEPMGSLKILDLAGNRLQFIDYDFLISRLFKLRLINIRENKLSCNFLNEMLHYFDHKNISFSIKEKLSYKEENVAGIPCQEYNKVNKSLIHTNSLLINDTKILNQIYEISTDDKNNLSASLNVTLLGLGLVILILFLVVVIISYRIYVIVKKRGFVSDEIELLDGRLHKLNNYS